MFECLPHKIKTFKNMSKKNKESFREFLQANLSWHDYEKLHEYLSRSRKMTTLIIDDPRKGEISDLLIIEMLLRKWNSKLDRDYLIIEFNFGLQETQTEVIR
jgi:hypothetical protein